jgi:ABC-2 type transport system permease protein
MMSVLQNAFANSSSSLIQSKVTGSIVFVLLPPISYASFSPPTCWPRLLRGLMVGASACCW